VQLWPPRDEEAKHGAYSPPTVSLVAMHDYFMSKILTQNDRTYLWASYKFPLLS